jgi:hypothetical protein
MKGLLNSGLLFSFCLAIKRLTCHLHGSFAKETNEMFIYGRKGEQEVLFFFSFILSTVQLKERGALPLG